MQLFHFWEVDSSECSKKKGGVRRKEGFPLGKSRSYSSGNWQSNEYCTPQLVSILPAKLREGHDTIAKIGHCGRASLS